MPTLHRYPYSSANGSRAGSSCHTYSIPCATTKRHIAAEPICHKPGRHIDTGADARARRDSPVRYLAGFFIRFTAGDSLPGAADPPGDQSLTSPIRPDQTYPVPAPYRASFPDFGSRPLPEIPVNRLFSVRVETGFKLSSVCRNSPDFDVRYVALMALEPGKILTLTFTHRMPGKAVKTRI